MAERGSPNLCCCCSLTTGGIIIGVLDIIGGIILTISSIVGFILSASGPDSENAVVLDTIFSILLIIALAVIILGVVMLHGINKKSIFLLQIWIIFKIVSLIIFTIYNIITLYSYLGSISLESATGGSVVAVYVSADIISYVVVIWFIVVIHFLRKEFQGGNGYEPVLYSKP